MRGLLLIEAMYRMRLWTPAGIWRLLSALRRHGANVMALLCIAERTYGDSTAMTDDRETATYRQLYTDSMQLAAVWRTRFKLEAGIKVGLAGRNRVRLARTVFAVSSTGADLYMLNPELSASQIGALAEEYGLQLLLYDEDAFQLADLAGCVVCGLGSLTGTAKDVESSPESQAQPRAASGRIMLLTGGTTGKSRDVAHRPSLLHYLPPFAALLKKLPYLRGKTVYVATPIAHGYGIANLFLFVALGYTIVWTPRFEAAQACRLIREQQVEVMTVVPLMLHKMLQHDAAALRSLICIASGGAALSPKLAAATRNRLGDVLFNLYGTTEGGLTTIATPQDMRATPGTIGKAIAGVPLHVLDEAGRKMKSGVAGRLCIRSRRGLLWVTRTSWIETGDIGIREMNGNYRLCGRVDDMIVSGGENVYPIEVEHIILEHPHVEDAAVLGVADEMFGQRLAAFVQLEPQARLTEAALRDWLRPRLARFQLPRDIVFMEKLPYTNVGKLNKKALK